MNGDAVFDFNLNNIFKLNVHFTDIQDKKNNVTRFLVLGKMIEEKGLKNKTTIKVNIKDQPGSLIKILIKSGFKIASNKLDIS